MFFIFFDFCSWIVEGLFFYFFYVCISLSQQQPFYFHKEHKLMGEERKKRTDLKNRCLKRAFLKLPIGEFALLEVGQGRWKTIL